MLKPSMAYGDGSSLRERVKGTRMSHAWGDGRARARTCATVASGTAVASSTKPARGGTQRTILLKLFSSVVYPLRGEYKRVS